MNDKRKTAGRGLVSALAVAVALLMVTSPLRADTPRATAGHTGDYVELFGFGSFATIDGVTANTGSPQIRNGSDFTGGPGIAIGYDWVKKGVPIRSELEFTYRVRFDYDLRIPEQAGYETNLHSMVLMANVYYDHEVAPSWTAYVGGGLGWAHHMSDVDRVALLGMTTTTRDDTTGALVWNAGVGALWRFRPNWNLDLRYRYIDLGEVASGPHTDGTVLEADTYRAHEFVIGLVYRF